MERISNGGKRFLTIAVIAVLSWGFLYAQSSADVTVLKGLAPVTALMNTSAGKAALGANFSVTGGIQTGSIRQPTLFPFAEQQQQALRDAFITDRNLAELADGLGTTLGSAYVARFHSIDEKQTSRLPESLGDLIRYATAVSGAHSNEGKYLFANGTTDGKTPVPSAEADIVSAAGGIEDVFGHAYHLQAGSPGADPYGNSRPYQTEPNVTSFAGPDYLDHPADNFVYNHGPVMDLTNSPSYPSGHTTYGYTGAVLLAVLVPERYAQMIARGAEYGNDRVIMGSHYVMDVLGGRTLALYDMAHLLANDPAYMGLSVRGAAPIADFQAVVKKARAELDMILKAGCGNTMDACAKEDTGRFSNAEADEAFYDVTQTYNLPAVYPNNAGAEDVSKLAPEAGYLLTSAFPSLTLEQADRILTETEGPGGGFLDDGSSFGVYSRLNLYEAGLRAERAAASHEGLRPSPSTGR
ncbi:MAG TPA: phosphatase PAP2 family protein [Acidobacteriaceae bacterium]|nr:phosphatase PAP2 family protein [Acidobacteriaceae bacterium]